MALVVAREFRWQASRMNLFFADAEYGSRRIGGASAAEILGSHGIREGTPFLIDKNEALTRDLNRYFRLLPLLGVGSPRSWREYASDTFVWIRWLREVREKEIWMADFDDVRLFHSARRDGVGSKSISANTWNRNVAALSKVYEYGLSEGLIATNPFRRVRTGGLPSMSRTHGSLATTVLYERPQSTKLTFLTASQFRDFCSVGMRGARTSGEAVPAGNRMTQANRNVTFAQVCATSGLRLTEAASILVSEVPAMNPKGGQKFEVAPSVAKRGKGRATWLPSKTVKAMREYIQFERATAVEVATERGTYLGQRWIRAFEVRPGVVRFDSRDLRVDQISPEKRRRLLLKGDDGSLEPAQLWLTSAGVPVSAASWRSAFDRASKRCQAHGLGLNASPHSLRHTFAVYALRCFVDLLSGSDRALPPIGSSAYHQLAFDPLRMVQLLLGHSSMETTLIYLDALPEVEGHFEVGASQLARQLCRL